jgi:hypothetical protein
MAWKAVAADDFNRAAGAIGGNYSVLKGGLTISSGEVHGTSSGQNVGVWSASAFANNQYSRITIGAQGQHWAIVRASASSSEWNGYGCAWNSETPIAAIYRVVGGTPTQLASISTAAGFFSSGDTLAITATGPLTSGWAVTLKMFKNGTSVGIGYDNSSFGNYTSGAAGFVFILSSAANDGYGDNWSGGNVVPIESLRTRIERRFV